MEGGRGYTDDDDDDDDDVDDKGPVVAVEVDGDDDGMCREGRTCCSY